MANTRWAGKMLISSAIHLANGIERFLVARLIFKWMTGDDPVEVDHIDRNPANNRWNNLREATSAGNNANKAASRRNKLGIKGVHLRRDTGKYAAHIRFNGRNIALGSFSTAEAAHAAYMKEARKQWGQFANGG